MKINDYVRTKKGIGKITNISINSSYNFKVITTDNFNIGVFTKNKCKRTDLKSKSSPNIIDLIELGDLIRVEWGKEDDNIFEVIAIDKENNEIGIFKNDFNIYFVGIEQIKSILTKEQFESMKYEVEDEYKS